MPRITVPKLSIVVPCYNEVDNIPNIIACFREIIGDKEGYELIMVDNGSSDDTALSLQRELAYSENTFVRSVTVRKNIGYGHGIMAGVNEASGDVIAWTHADLQINPIDVMKAFEKFNEQADYIKCVLKGQRINRHIIDRFFTLSMSIVCLIMLGKWITDINAQPKIFHRNMLTNINNSPYGFSLDLYLLVQARVNRYRILEYPVHVSKRVQGESKGGGTLRGKIRYIKNTWPYLLKLRKELKG